MLDISRSLFVCQSWLQRVDVPPIKISAAQSPENAGQNREYRQIPPRHSPCVQNRHGLVVSQDVQKLEFLRRTPVLAQEVPNKEGKENSDYAANGVTTTVRPCRQETGHRADADVEQK